MDTLRYVAPANFVTAHLFIGFFEQPCTLHPRPGADS